jgi:uncharacterized protein
MIDVLVHFGQQLRAEGLAVGTGDLLTFSAALAGLSPSDIQDVYWAGRATLVIRRDDIPVYDRVFRSFFLDDDSSFAMILKSAMTGAETTFDVPSEEPGGEHEEALLGLLASNVEVLRTKEFTACTDTELAALRRIMAEIRLTPPRRRTRRTAPGKFGRLDMRRTIRAALRTGGDPVTLRHQQRRTKPRPLVLILDVSGSMASYSRALLQFAYSAHQAATHVEVFCFGTRLARVTKQLRHRDPDDALSEAASQVTDWDGGTRIGHSLARFVRDWGRLARGATVVVCSDGLDRGDPDTLATALDRLSRRCHSLIWLNPHKNDRPQTVAMMIADPHIDILLPANNLDSLQELVKVLAMDRPPARRR